MGCNSPGSLGLCTCTLIIVLHSLPASLYFTLTSCASEHFYFCSTYCILWFVTLSLLCSTPWLTCLYYTLALSYNLPVDLHRPPGAPYCPPCVPDCRYGALYLLASHVYCPSNAVIYGSWPFVCAYWFPFTAFWPSLLVPWSFLYYSPLELSSLPPLCQALLNLLSIAMY